MEDLGNETPRITMSQVKRWSIVSIVGCLCFIVGFGYALFAGFHLVHSGVILDNAFGALWFLGVILMVISILKLHPNR